MSRHFCIQTANFQYTKHQIASRHFPNRPLSLHLPIVSHLLSKLQPPYTPRPALWGEGKGEG